MRNRNIVRSTGLLALTFAGSMLATPVSIAIPDSYLGLAHTVNVVSRDYPILSGGSFNALVGDPTLANAVNATFWCVDLENHINPGSSSAIYLANLIPVGQTTAQAQYVQKGIVTAWEDGEALNAQQRYTGAGYLIEKILAGSSAYSDVDIVRAIWRLTDTQGGNNTDNSPVWENPAYADALNFLSQPNAATEHVWATVSGCVGPNGDLTCNTRQTFLVEVAQVPEPATYAMMGAGLLALGLIGRRKKNAS